MAVATSRPVAEVARRFSTAASQYGEHAKVQPLTAALLLAQLPARAERARWLDIGCGPGTDFSSLAPQQVVALDVAPGMLQQLQQRFPTYAAVRADAQCLPFKNNCFDIVFSNLALQWCRQLPVAIAEIQRVLRPGGSAHLALVVDGSLPQLQQLGLQVKSFARGQEIQQLLQAQGWREVVCSEQVISCYFDSLRALLYSVKGVGASVTAPLGQGLKGQRHWLTLQEQAEQWRSAQGLPLSYRVLLVHAYC